MKYKRILAPIIAGILFGLVFVAGKYLANVIPPATMSFLRYGFTSLFFIPFLIIYRKSFKNITVPNWGFILLASLLGIVGYHILFYWALHFTSSTNVSLIHAINPILTLILAAIFIREKISLKIIGSFALAVIGIIIVVSKGLLTNLFSTGLNKGELLMASATIMWALYTIILKRIGKENITPIMLTGIISILGWIMLTPFSLYEVNLDFFKHIAFTTWLALIYMGIGSSGLGYFLYTKSAQNLGPSLTSLATYTTVPIVVALVSLVWLGTPINIVQIVGFGFIASGLFSAMKSDVKTT